MCMAYISSYVCMHAWYRRPVLFGVLRTFLVYILNIHTYVRTAAAVEKLESIFINSNSSSSSSIGGTQRRSRPAVSDIYTWYAMWKYLYIYPRLTDDVGCKAFDCTTYWVVVVTRLYVDGMIGKSAVYS